MGGGGVGGGRKVRFARSAPLWLELVVTVPVVAAGSAPLLVPLWVLRSPDAAAAAAVVVVAVAAACFTRPVELWLATRVRGGRLASGDVAARLVRLSAPLLARAGVVRRPVFVVERSGGVNAFTSGRHVVGVTEGALRLPDRALAAVLAHEIGHQLERDTWAAELRWLFQLPLTLMRRVTFAVGNLLTLAFGLSLVGVVVWVTVMVAGWLLVAPSVLVAPAVAAISRRNEFGADAVAAKLGFGAELAAVLAAMGSPRRSWWRSLMESHPAPHLRVRRLARSPLPPLR